MGLVTLFVAGIAAAYAKRAATATENQLRPWIAVNGVQTVEGVGITTPKGFYADATGFTVAIVNSGASPAVNMRTNWTVRAVPKDDPVPPMEVDPQDEMRGVLLAKEPTLLTPLFLSDEETQIYRRRQVKAVIYVKITYQSPFTPRKTHVTEACYEAFHGGAIGQRQGDAPQQYRPTGPQNQMT